MAMFECPGCKHIVDDSIKKCPNCSYDIKKYVKAMMKDAKKNGKTINESSLALSSVYSSDNSKGGALPTLDFLSKPAAPASSGGSASASIFDSPSLNVKAAAPAPSVTFDSPSLNAKAAAPAPSVTFDSPSLNAKAAAPAPSVTFDSPSLNAKAAAPAPSVTFDSPSLNAKAVAPAPSVTFDSPSLNAKPVEPVAPVTSSFSTSSAPVVLPISNATEKNEGTVFSGLSKPAVPVAAVASEPEVAHAPVTESVFETPEINKTSEFIHNDNNDEEDSMFSKVSLDGVQKFSTPEAVIPSAIPSSTSFSPIGRTLQNGGTSIHIEAPSIPAPERTPVVSTGSSIPKAPVYNDAPVSKPVTPEAAPIFDSPALNAAQNSNTRIAQPASAASMASISKPAPSYGSYGSTSISQPAATATAPATSLGTTASSTTNNTSSDNGGFVFESAALNEQARKIASGEYIPESRASQATLSMLEKDVSEIVAKASISHRTFGQAPQQASYKPLSPELGGGIPQQTHSANPLLAGATGQASTVPQNVYAQNNYSSPAGQTSLYGTGQPVAPSNYAQQAPAYGSFGNASIPTNGQTGVGAQNPLLAGNPLLGGGRQ